MRYTEKSLSDISFWRDSVSIENYSNTLLKYCEKDVQLKINISSALSTPKCAYKGNNRFLIELPKPQDYYTDILNQEKDILARKVFLKHELAHILFSDFSLFSDHHSLPGTSFHFLWNALEDIRIENLFGKKFSGANDSFFEVQNMYFKKSKKGIENSKKSIQSLALYFIFRSKGSLFKSTDSTKVYEDMFLKYGNFIDLDASQLKDLISKILLDFEGAIEQEPQVTQQDNNEESNTDEDSNSQSSGEEENKNQETAASNDSEENDEDIDNDIDTSSDENEDMNSTEFEDSFDTQDDVVEDESDSNSIDENQSEENDESSNTSDTSSMINDLMNSVSQDEKESFNDSINESDVLKDKESFDESLRKLFDLSQGMPQPKDEEINFYKNLMKMSSNFCTFKEGELNEKESQIVPIRRYYKKILSLNGREDITRYNEIVKRNKKNIVGITNYFKLKFQNKERNKTFNNREEGILNNSDLFKILIKNKNDSTIFSKVESSIVNKSNIVFLLDFSSSMRGSSIQTLIETMIVMNEVFSKLKIPYEMYAFSGASNYKLKYSKKIKSVSNLFGSNVYISSDQRKNGISYLSMKDTNGTYPYPLFQLRSLKDIDYTTDKKILGKLYGEAIENAPLLCDGSTPEINAILALRKNVHFSNKKLFIINDGEYNKFYKEKEMSSEQKTLTSHEVAYKGIPAKILHSFLNNKSFVLGAPSDIDIFKNISSNIKNAMRYSNPIDQFYITKTLKETKEVYDFMISLSNELGDLDYNSLLKKEKIKIGSFGTISIKSVNKNISLSFSVNENAFSIINTSPQINESYKLKLGQNTWDWNTLSTFISWCYANGNESYSNDLINDRIYTSFIEKIRNEGWGVYGIGIASNRGKKYIGEKYFTVVDQKDIQETLVQKIKEII